MYSLNVGQVLIIRELVLEHRIDELEEYLDALPSSTPEIVLIWSEGDWEGLYVDGEIKAQGHSVEVADLAKALGLSISQKQINEEYAMKAGGFPNRLKDCPLEMEER